MPDQYLPDGPVTDDPREIPEWAEKRVTQKFRPSEVPEGMTAWEAFDHTDHFHKRYDDLMWWLQQEPEVWVLLGTSNRRISGGVTSPYPRRGLQVAARKRPNVDGKESFNIYVRYAPEKMAQRSRYAPNSRLSEQPTGENPLPE